MIDPLLSLPLASDFEELCSVADQSQDMPLHAARFEAWCELRRHRVDSYAQIPMEDLLDDIL